MGESKDEKRVREALEAAKKMADLDPVPDGLTEKAIDLLGWEQEQTDD